MHIQGCELAQNLLFNSTPQTICKQVICIGMNYRDHCLEQNIPPPKEPVVFSKFSSCIIGPYEDLTYPDITEVICFIRHDEAL